MKWLKNNLANFFTLGNLACGFLGIVFVLDPQGTWVYLPFWLMILAAVLDFFDGFIARATRTTSKIGADLDSLADMVTFGVLPGVMIWSVFPDYFKYIGIIIPLMSAWRLAKFNNDTRGNEFFYGLATPANAIFIAGLTYSSSLFKNASCSPPFNGEFNYLNAILVVILCSLMVSDIKLLSNKIKPFTLANAKWHLLVLLVAVILILLFGYLGVSLAIISYVLISIIITFATAKSSKKVS